VKEEKKLTNFYLITYDANSFGGTIGSLKNICDPKHGNCFTNQDVQYDFVFACILIDFSCKTPAATGV